MAQHSSDTTFCTLQTICVLLRALSVENGCSQIGLVPFLRETYQRKVNGTKTIAHTTAAGTLPSSITHPRSLLFFISTDFCLGNFGGVTKALILEGTELLLTCPSHAWALVQVPSKWMSVTTNTPMGQPVPNKFSSALTV